MFSEKKTKTDWFLAFKALSGHDIELALHSQLQLLHNV